jgi:hypothetical protein
VSTPDAAAEGRARAEEFLRLLDAGDPAADALLAGLADIRDLVFLGAGLTGLARALGRSLPPAQRAQSSTRQLRLAALRDGSREVGVPPLAVGRGRPRGQRSRVATRATGSAATSTTATSA